ncbi:hypothetical protein B0T21DRAFT_346404 [Apiosordaria backusii]|uniref:Uncharacterized protein n=1 Tax=Apiosordaria backusii TaxID=314023 RepID=A0AA40BRH1_9PEZI|nr:hypothetical protein B0T21DRAFT_346404 [Apiosordaria backusii]
MVPTEVLPYCVPSNKVLCVGRSLVKPNIYLTLLNNTIYKVLPYTLNILSSSVLVKALYCLHLLSLVTSFSPISKILITKVTNFTILYYYINNSPTFTVLKFLKVKIEFLFFHLFKGILKAYFNIINNLLIKLLKGSKTSSVYFTL